MTKVVWYSKGLVDYLNSKGFVYFYDREPALDHYYKEGTAFYYNKSKKEYGRIEICPEEQIVECNRRTKLLRNLIRKAGVKMKRLKYTVRDLEGKVLLVSYSEDQAYTVVDFSKGETIEEVPEYEIIEEN